MRSFTLLYGVLVVLLISSMPCLGQENDGFHSYANLSDTDKINLVIQDLNRAIQGKNVDGVIECLPVPLRSDSTFTDSVRVKFGTLFQRMNTVLGAIGMKRIPGNRMTDDPVFHLSEPTPTIIDPDTAALTQPIYLGDNPVHYCDTVCLCLSSWFGMYGITNALELVASMEAVLDKAVEEPELLVAEASTPRTAAKSLRISTDLPNLLKHKRFYQDDDRSVDVFNKTAAHTEFDGKDLFGRPYDVIDAVIYTLGNNHWGMLATDANWDRYICFGKKGGNQFISGGAHYGPTNSAFRFPAGVSLLTDQDLYICDAYHNKVTRFSVNFVGCNEDNPPTINSALSFGDDIDFNFPVDVDAGHIPFYAPFNYNCFFHNWIAICDQGNNRLVLTSLQGGLEQTLGSHGSGQFQLDRPTSVAFARDHQTGWQLHDLFVADAGNRRVVKFCTQVFGIYNRFIASHDSVFAANAYLTSVEVDPFGQVYVLDGYNGVVYKFDDTLQFIGKWGDLGADENQLYYPTRLSNTRGWHDFTDTLCEDNPILYPTRLGDMLVTELYSATTGIKRFEISNDLLDFQAGYQGRICNFADDYFYMDWEQADYGFVRTHINFMCYSKDTTAFYGPGRQHKEWPLPYYGQTTGVGNIGLTLYSAYNTTTPVASQSLTVEYDRDTCNFPPVFTYYPNLLNNEDSCAVWGQKYECAVNILDADGGDHWYSWTSPVGHFIKKTEPYSLYDSLPNQRNLDRVYIRLDRNQGAKIDLDEIFTVTVRDAFGGVVRGTCCKAMVNSMDECTWYPPPPECPILYYYDKGEWQMVNNLLAESETAVGLRGNVAEIYPIPEMNADQTGRLRLRITEEADEVTSLQSLRAVQISYPDTLSLIMANGNRPFALTDYDVPPALAYTAAGDTVTDMIKQSDGTSFSDVSPGSLFVEYVFDSSQEGYSKPLSWAPGGPGLPPPGKEISKVRVSTEHKPSRFYEIFARNESGGWVSVAKSFPRLVKTGQYFELSEYIVGNRLALRVDYHDSIAVDYLPFHLYQPVTVTPRPMQLVSASHNAAGDVTAMIANDQGPEVVVKRGESLDLVFQGSPPPAGYKQMVLFASQGRYEKASDFDVRSHGITFNQNYPNPFNPNTSFRYFLPEARKVTLEVYNVLGQKVVVLTDGLQTAGEHVVNWDSRDGHGDAVASGIYFARFTAGDYTATKKLEVLK